MPTGEIRGGMTEDIYIANRNFPASRVFGFHLMPVRIDATFTVGATGAVGTVTGPGIKAITRLAAGVYQVQLQDNYSTLLETRTSFIAPVTGSSVPDESLSVGTLYQITSVGTTNWTACGLPAGVTAAVGQAFVATAAGSGTGTAKAIGTSGITNVEVCGTFEQVQPFIQGTGGIFLIKTSGPTAADNTALVATDPAQNSIMTISMWLNNSSVQ